MQRKNVGETIKKVAVAFGVIVCLGCFITAIVFYVNAGDSRHHSQLESDALALWGHIFMFGGTIGNAIFALLMYGFGELISVTIKRYSLEQQNFNPAPNPTPTPTPNPAPNYAPDPAANPSFNQAQAASAQRNDYQEDSQDGGAPFDVIKNAIKNSFKNNN